ncbi:hypothetical protein L195_g054332 [Trifolium pratense]|uniref:Uncharacterized protein n=1 Tax=Trifolium pratense TaxID=57577 RepID=A0A2K3KFK9_TRIPR|nr:hypothetical protein L195_g054332 [Trifolium pratense]
MEILTIASTDVVLVPEDETRINDVLIQKFHNGNLVVNEQVGQNIDGGMHSGTMAMTDIIDNGAKDQQRKSFAQALQNSCDVPHDHLPKPCLKGEDIAIKIPEEEYKRIVKIIFMGDCSYIHLSHFTTCVSNYSIFGSLWEDGALFL